VDNDWDFSSPEVDVSGISDSQYTPGTPLSDDAYFHRVRALVDGSPTPWAAEWLVVIDAGNLIAASSTVAFPCSCPHKYQRKDTNLLCIWSDSDLDPEYRPGCLESGDYAWDRPHPNAPPPNPNVQVVHGTNYCWAASIAMVNAKYGGDLSQDRIAYQNWTVVHPIRTEPEGDLGHALRATDPEIRAVLRWALNGTAIDYIPRFPPLSFTFEELKRWISQLDCFVGGVPGHCLVLDGYAELTSTTGTDIQVVYAQDPWLGPNWAHVFSYVIEGADQKYFRRHRQNVFDAVWLQPAGGATGRMQEATVTKDSDGDGIMDFDEINRFQSDKDIRDTDKDQVPDKNDIRNYTFHDTYCEGHDNDALDFPDMDKDGLRAENDCDSDSKDAVNGDGDFDGGEDIDGDGHNVIPRNPGPPVGRETCMFNPADSLLTVSVDKDVYMVGEPVYIVDIPGRYTRTYHANSIYNYELDRGCPDKKNDTPLRHDGLFATDAGGRAFKTLVHMCPAPGDWYLTVDVLGDFNYSEPDNTDPQTCWECITPCYILVDDFERYGPYIDSISRTWHDGYGYAGIEIGYPGNGTGSRVDIESATVHKGAQSMRFDYDNTGTGRNIFGDPITAYYSEAVRTFDGPQDWTTCGVKALSLWFYIVQPDANEPPIAIYVAVEDGMGHTAVVGGEHPIAPPFDTWREWNIDLREFSDEGVDLTNVRRMYVGVGDRNDPQPGGTGTIYFDSIRSYPRRCVPEQGPLADFTNDCVVDSVDLRIMGQEWLDGSLLGKPDLNWDGMVDLKDFVYLAGMWLCEQEFPCVRPCPIAGADESARCYVEFEGSKDLAKMYGTLKKDSWAYEGKKKDVERLDVVKDAKGRDAILIEYKDGRMLYAHCRDVKCCESEVETDTSWPHDVYAQIWCTDCQ
ncbi:MAG: hypothetical protein JSU70_22845, partial [Phycisphaerales bacterium]